MAHTMRAGIVAMLGTAMLTGCTVFGIRSAEEPAFTVLDQVGDIVEVRRYPERVAAEDTVQGADDRETRNQAFELLFDYISGANRSQTSIAMTTPVQVEAPGEQVAMTVPVQTRLPAPGQYTMLFYLPATYTQATAPQPTDPRVKLLAVPEETLAVLRYSGSSDQSEVVRRQAELLAALEGSRWQPAGEPLAYFYDPPWTIPFLRRNEVAVPVTARQL
jgi:SOUL heme-binding protein